MVGQYEVLVYPCFQVARGMHHRRHQTNHAGVALRTTAGHSIFLSLSTRSGVTWKHDGIALSHSPVVTYFASVGAVRKIRAIPVVSSTQLD